MSSRQRALSTLIGIAVTLFFLWLALRDVAWAEVHAAFAAADYRLVAPAALLVAADYWFRSVRWRHIIPGRPISTHRLFPVLIIGFAANNLIPARVGELWRIWGLSRREQVDKSTGLATLVVERVFDGLTLVFLLALFSLLVPLNDQANAIKYAFAALFGGTLAALVGLLLFGEPVERLVARLVRPVPLLWQERLLGIVRRFTGGLAALRSPRRLVAVVLFSLAAWLSEAVVYFLLMAAFGVTLPPAQMVGGAVLLLTLINLGILIPSAPGYLGTYEYFGKLALVSVLGVSEGPALGVVVLAHALQYAIVTALGLFFMVRLSLSWTPAPALQPLQPPRGSEPPGGHGP